MAQKKNPKADEAYALFQAGEKLVTIGQQLGVPEGTVRRWKNTYGWAKANTYAESERSDSIKASVRIDTPKAAGSTVTQAPPKAAGSKAVRHATRAAGVRADRVGANRVAFEKNRKKILASCDVCAICGQPVDKSLKAPHPLSPAIDHIIPLAKGGHPSDISNLQLTHRVCNDRKHDKINAPGYEFLEETISNRELPQSHDWKTF